MANYKAEAQFARARWRAVILLPFWALQLLLTMSMMGLFSWRLGDTLKNFDERENNGRTPTIEFVWEATNIVMSFIAALCTLIEIVKFMAQTLTPWTVLFTHVIKLTCASAILALDVVIYAQRKEYYSLVGLGLDAILFITAIALVIYSIVTYRRLSAFDDYVRPPSVQVYDFGDGNERDFSYSSRTGIMNSMDKHAPLVSHRMSTGSIRSVSNESVGLQTIQRTPGMYIHERDTQFDDYVARRSSLGAVSDMERRMSGELRRNSPPRDRPADAQLGTATLNSRPRVSSITREMTYMNDHVLVAVPEEEHEALHETPYTADKSSLLGRSRQNSDELMMQLHPATQEVDITEPKWLRK